jgi:hypothetical protein
MNEKIKELKEQCWVNKHWNAEDEIWSERRFDSDKFAELIIEECIWQVVKDDEVPQNIQVLIGERFKQHFGVKE